MRELPAQALDEMRTLSEQVGALREENQTLADRLIESAERQASSRDSIVRLREKVRQQREAISVLTGRIALLDEQLRLQEAFMHGRIHGIHETYERVAAGAPAETREVSGTLTASAAAAGRPGEGAETAQKVSVE